MKDDSFTENMHHHFHVLKLFFPLPEIFERVV